MSRNNHHIFSFDNDFFIDAINFINRYVSFKSSKYLDNLVVFRQNQTGWGLKKTILTYTSERRSGIGARSKGYRGLY